MMLRSGLFIISCFLLVGCVNKNFGGFDPNLEWSIRGKISVSSSEFARVYNFSVFNKNEANEIVVSSLFGIELYRVALLPSGISVEDSLFNSYRGQSKELNDAFENNLRFIWRWLPRWVAGQDQFGEPLEMFSEADGWSIEFSDFNGISPRVITLDKRGLRAKIRISHFENLI